MNAFTHPRIREIADYLDSVRGRLAAVVEGTPRAVLTAGQRDGRWNGAQIVQHLGKVEGSTAKLLEGVFTRSLASGIPSDSSTSSLLGSLDRFQADGDVPRPLVAPERLRPTPDAELDASWDSLAAVRERTYRAYATVDGRDLTTVGGPHPLFGPLNAYEWLLFIGKHEERHLGQLQRQIAGAA